MMKLEEQTLGILIIQFKTSYRSVCFPKPLIAPSASQNAKIIIKNKII
jgi:hypothetical protein